MSKIDPPKKPIGPVPPLKQQWRPKVTPRVTPSPEPKPDLVDPILEPSLLVSSLELHQNIPKVNVASLSKVTAAEVPPDSWAMLLREGKRIFTPPMPPIPLSTNPFSALSMECLNTVCGEKTLEVWGDTSLSAGEVSTPLESDLVVSGESEMEGCWDDETLWVEPLAVSYPVVEGSSGPVNQAEYQGGHDTVLSTPKGPQSTWALDQLKEFGLILGASFADFEDKIMELLVDIEASSGLGCEGAGSQYRKGDKSRMPRELHNLISGVNYAGGSSRRTSSTSGRALMLSQ